MAQPSDAGAMHDAGQQSQMLSKTSLPEVPSLPNVPSLQSMTTERMQSWSNVLDATNDHHGADPVVNLMFGDYSDTMQPSGGLMGGFTS
eukprot:SAG31_NODE_25922_length_451_cov_1.161932_1_plen_88_part_10